MDTELYDLVVTVQLPHHVYSDHIDGILEYTDQSELSNYSQYALVS